MAEIKRQWRDSLISEVNPGLLRLYLLARGWRHVSNFKSLATIWRSSGQENVFEEVVLPTLEAKDYPERMFDALVVLARLENQEPQELVREILALFADRISVRVIHPDVSDGTIPLEDGVELNQRARDLMAAAVLTTSSRRKYYTGPRSPEAKAFLNTLRLGQTSHGSYIVNVLVPIEPLEKAQTEIETTSLARVVTDNLASSLDALSEAVTAYADHHELNVFDNAIQEGASANMCDALVGISGENEGRQFEITITSAAGIASPSTKKSYYFDNEAISSIRDASEYYKDNFVLPDKVVLGYVKRLDRPIGSEIGTITIEANVNDVQKHIQIELTHDDYEEAVNAHKERAPVECRGDLHVAPRKALLLNPSQFKVLRSQDLL